MPQLDVLPVGLQVRSVRYFANKPPAQDLAIAHGSGSSWFYARFCFVDGFIAVGAVAVAILGRVHALLLARLRRRLRTRLRVDAVVFFVAQQSFIMRNISGVSHFFSSNEIRRFSLNQIFRENAVR